MKQYFFLLLSIMAICLASCVDPPAPDPTPVQYTLFNPPILLKNKADTDISYHVVQPIDSVVKLYGQPKVSDSIDVNQDGIYDLKFYLGYTPPLCLFDYIVEPLHKNIYCRKGFLRDTIRIDDNNWIQETKNIRPYDTSREYLYFKIMDKDGPHVGWIRHSLLPPDEYIWYIESMAYSTQPYYEFVVGEKK